MGCNNCRDTGLKHVDGTVKTDERDIGGICRSCDIAQNGNFPQTIKTICNLVRLSAGDVIFGKKILSGGVISTYDLYKNNIPEEFMDTRK